MEKIKENWPFKLISLIFAIALWYYVVSETNPNIKKEYKAIPVSYKNESVLKRKNMAIIDPIDPVVNVTLEGKRNVISRVSRNDILVYADMNELNENGEVSLNFSVPQGTSIIEKSDYKLTLKLDEIMTLVKKVEVKRIGELPSDNTTVTDIEVVPGEVKITDQKELIDKIAKVIVPVDLSVITKDTSISKKIQILDSNDTEIKELDAENTDVTVNVFVSSTKQVPIKLSYKNQPFDFKSEDLKASKTKMTIIGQKEKLDKIKEISTETVDLSDFINNTTKNIKMEFPEGIAPLSAEDKFIDVTYSSNVGEGKPSKLFNVSTENIEVLNKASGKALILPSDLSEVSVRVFGDEKVVENIRLKDFKLQIDLKDLTDGEHDVPIIIVLDKEGIDNTLVYPSTIKIKIVNE
ncbi:YbbR-like domain-containing protein [Mediannikoviicoccus vaginalis]|uniref:CdaR family protein n=1 Tax=Mediannikoviicoccus vaginalis TaxID=2899727 RepID=UPI001F18B1C8|nr:CdaR family protein [Mediannikoviicoccus vaginalis]